MTSSGDSGAPLLASARRTISSLARSCAAGATCIHGQPPHVPASAHGGATRSPASSTRTTSPRANAFLRSVSRASTTSPGAPPATNTTRPDGSRPTASPPNASASSFSVMVSSTYGCVCAIVLCRTTKSKLPSRWPLTDGAAATEPCPPSAIARRSTTSKENDAASSSP